MCRLLLANIRLYPPISQVRISDFYYKDTESCECLKTNSVRDSDPRLLVGADSFVMQLVTIENRLLG